LVEALLDHGAGVDSRGSDGTSALMIAANNRHRTWSNC
jgi:ankyrin repeat protein